MFGAAEHTKAPPWRRDCVPLVQDETVVTEQMDFSSLLFGNPVTFLAFLAEEIKRTILATDRNDTVDVCQIITEAVGGSMGILVDAKQLNL